MAKENLIAHDTQIRVMGYPEHCLAIVAKIASMYPLISVSSQYLNNDGETVRIYVNILHEAEKK